MWSSLEFSCCWEAVPPSWLGWALALVACTHLQGHREVEGTHQRIPAEGFGHPPSGSNTSSFLIYMMRRVRKAIAFTPKSQQVPKKPMCILRNKLSSIKLICMVLLIIRLQKYWLYLCLLAFPITRSIHAYIKDFFQYLKYHIISVTCLVVGQCYVSRCSVDKLTRRKRNCSLWGT